MKKNEVVNKDIQKSQGMWFSGLVIVGMNPEWVERAEWKEKYPNWQNQKHSWVRRLAGVREQTQGLGWMEEISWKNEKLVSVAYGVKGTPKAWRNPSSGFYFGMYSFMF